MSGAGEAGAVTSVSGNLVAMERFTGADRAFCVREFYQNNNSATVARRKFREHKGLHNFDDTPALQTIKNWVAKFEETGSTLDKPRLGRPRTSRTEQNIDTVAQSIRENPTQSTRKRSSALNVSRTSLQRILKKDLLMHPYKIQLVQELKETDAIQRVNYANEMFNRFTSFNNIMFSDEAHFHINGHVSKQNCRYWSPINPKLKHQKPLHSPKVTVWAAMSAHGIIGPYFFEDGRGRAVTVTSERYVAMIEEFFTQKLQNFPGFNARTWFQQDGATSHTSNTAMPVIRQLFPNKVISKRGDISWPPRSPDLTPMDFFLWGYLKAKVYDSNPRSINDLKENIRREMASISAVTCRAVIDNFRRRLQECRDCNGLHLDDVIYKK